MQIQIYIFKQLPSLYGNYKYKWKLKTTPEKEQKKTVTAVLFFQIINMTNTFL